MFKESLTYLVLTTSIVSLFTSGAFGAFGAMIRYLHLVVKGTHEYSFWNLIAYMVLGLFVGVLADRLMHETIGQVYQGIILLSGFLTIRILDFLDINGLPLLVERAGIKVQSNKDD